MLHGLRLIDIGNHKDTTLRLGPLTAILGPNGAGKTTVLKAIELVTHSVPIHEDDLGLESISWTVRDQVIRANLAEARIAGGFSFSGEPKVSCARNLTLNLVKKTEPARVSTNCYPMWLLHVGDDGQHWMPNDLTSDQLWGYQNANFRDIRALKNAEGIRALGNGDWPTWEEGVLSALRFAHPHLRYLQLSTQLLKRPSYSEAVTPIMADDGTDLASVLAHLMTSDRITFATIVEAVRKVVPTVKDIRATRCPMTVTESRSVTVNKREVPYSEPREVIGQQLRFDMTSGEDLPAERISDGTMLVLAIVTILKTMPGALILLDDLEQGLHPSAQREVIQLIKAIQKDDPEMQVVFTTHSPYIVDELEPENVWVLGLDKEGCAHAKALSEHPNAKRAMEVLTTGEFWSAEGEDWVVPTAE